MRPMPVLFILLALLLVALIAPAAAQTFPTLTPVPTVLIPATPTETPCAEPLPFTIGQRVVLTPGVNVRNLPSLSGGVVNYYTEEVVLRITDGPSCANGYNWWRVAGVGNPGWVVEGRPGRYFLAPAAPLVDSVCFEPLNLAIGGTTRLITGVRVRESPDARARVLTVMLIDETVTVIGGPVCAGDINWWQVRVPSNGTLIEGWVAEGFPDNYWLEAPMPIAAQAVSCARALRLPPGARAAVTYSDGVPRRLRAAPSLSAEVIAPLINNVAFEITGAPVCADGYNWFPVRVLGADLSGWLAEGRPGNYWFNIISETDAVG